LIWKFAYKIELVEISLTVCTPIRIDHFYLLYTGNNCSSDYPSLITFDGITDKAVIGIANGYSRLSWSNVIFVAASSQQAGSGFETALTSGSYVASNGFGVAMNISTYQM
jgi:hypothetical protein